MIILNPDEITRLADFHDRFGEFSISFTISHPVRFVKEHLIVVCKQRLPSYLMIQDEAASRTVME